LRAASRSWWVSASRGSWLAALAPAVALSLTSAQYSNRLHALSAHQSYYVLGLTAALAFVALAALLAVAYRSGCLPANRFALAAVALLLAEPLSTFILPLYYVIDSGPAQSASALSGAPYISYLKEHALDGARTLGEDGVLVPNWGDAFELSGVGSLSTLYPPRYLAFCEAMFDIKLDGRFVPLDLNFRKPLAERFLTLSSVRFVAAPYRMDLFSKNFSVAYADKGAVVYRYASPLPRVAVYAHVAKARDGDASLKLLQSAGFDPGSTAVAEGNDPALDALAAAPPAPVAAGRLVAYSSRYVRTSVDAAKASLVVLNDSAFPGWHAYVDGERAPISTANYLFRGVPVGAGRHTVEFRYEPTSFTLGAWITAISLLALVALLAGPAVAHRRVAHERSAAYAPLSR
jgi:hypothetical protein